MHASNGRAGNSTAQRRSASNIWPIVCFRPLTVRCRSFRQQPRHLPTALGEVHLDVAEVALDAAAGRMVQQQVRLPLPLATGARVPADLVVPAAVAVLVAQTLEDPMRRVPLLLRGRPVVVE